MLVGFPHGVQYLIEAYSQMIIVLKLNNTAHSALDTAGSGCEDEAKDAPASYPYVAD
jgi:hypothetical protein